ncbi:MAG: serine/threonine-protein kinase [Myxococcota bacterium]
MKPEDRHALDTLDAERVLANVTERLFDEAPSPTRVGRFVLLDRLGAGGMGAVYSAFDPQLDRRVAIKVLHGGGHGDDEPSHGNERLLQEARALARLSHPHVVTVYEVGTVGDRVFIAMELVDGETLDRWLRRRPPWREVLRVFRLAGRGLAAAHGEGLVHRDFKPSNVMLGSDGRVLVLDFGLARVQMLPDLLDSARIRAGVSLPDGAPDETRAVVGTPRYMSPEQFAGEPVDHRSDQFSFCVSLFEALFDTRPYPGSSLTELAGAVHQGPAPTVPRKSPIPRRICAAILRGLSPHPEARHPSMEALLAGLDGPARPWWQRPSTWLGMAAVSMGALALTTAWSGTSTSGPCADAPSRVYPAWNEERRESMHAAFEGTALPYADQAQRGATRTLDLYAQRWAEAYHEACAATRIRGEQSEALYGRRMACLQERLTALEATTALLARADADVVRNAADMTHRLPPLDACGDVATQFEQDATLTEAERATRARWQPAIARATALRRAGKYEEATVAIDAIRNESELDDDPWLRVQTGLELGILQERAGEHEAAAQTVKDALWAAVEAGDDAKIARAASTLVTVVGWQLRHTKQGRDWGRMARAVLARMPDPLHATAVLESALGNLSYSEGRFEEAVGHKTRALEIQRDLLSEDDPRLATLHSNLGLFYAEHGDLEASLRHNRLAVDLRQRVLGPKHPRTAMALNGLAGAMRRAGQIEDALRHYDRALTIWRQTLGPEHAKVAMVHNNMANAIAMAGRNAEAIEHYREAIRIWRAFDGGHDNRIAHARMNLGLVMLRLDRPAEGLVELQAALRTMTESLGDDHADTIRAHINLSTAERMLDRPETALEHARAATRLAQRDRLAEHSLLAQSKTVEGEALAALGRHDEAIVALEQGVSIYRQIQVAATERADAQMQLATLLVHRDAPADRPAAVTLVREARMLLEDDATASGDRIAQFDAWLAEHDPGC